jgi:hypothetical protein
VPPGREGDQVDAVGLGVEDGHGRVLVEDHARLNAQRPGPQPFRHADEISLGVRSKLLLDYPELLPWRLPRRITGGGQRCDDPKQCVFGPHQGA